MSPLNSHAATAYSVHVLSRISVFIPVLIHHVHNRYIHLLNLYAIPGPNLLQHSEMNRNNVAAMRTYSVTNGYGNKHISNKSIHMSSEINTLPAKTKIFAAIRIYNFGGQTSHALYQAFPHPYRSKSIALPNSLNAESFPKPYPYKHIK